MTTPNVDSPRSATDDDRVAAPFTDDELTALALAADADGGVAADAVPIGDFLDRAAGPLPDWYMPPVTAVHVGRIRQAVALVVVGAFALIEAAGLCSTYGQLPFH